MTRKEFSSFDVAAVVRELREAVLDSRVSNVYQLDHKTLLFKLRKREGSVFRLVLKAGKRLHLTLYSMEKPMIPPAFCMALRKYLRNGWLTGIEQHEFERVVIFTFKSRRGIMQLFLELFGDGNVILVDKEGQILHALRYKRMRDRDILRGEAFRFAPPMGKNPLKVEKEDFSKKLHVFSDVEVVKALIKSLGIGGFYSEEVLLRAGVDKNTFCGKLDEGAVDSIFAELQNLLFQVTEGELKPCIVLDEADRFVDVLPVRLRHYTDLKNQPYESFNKALDEFYVRVDAIDRALAAATNEVEELKREAERLKRIIKRQEEVLVEATSEADRDKRVADMIYAHAGELQTLLNLFLTSLENAKEWKEAVSEILSEKQKGKKPDVFFESFDAKHLVVNVYVDDLRFGLSLRKSVFENAARFYKRYKRSKRKLKGTQVALEESQEKLEQVEAGIEKAKASQEVKPAEVVEEIAERKIKRKKWFEKFRWFMSSDGFLVVAGKDAVSNEVLVKKYAEKDDVIFHADVKGAPFVVLKTEGKKPSEECFREAGEYAASFSRGWREGFASVDVYWVRPDQLGKAGGTGEYVPRGSFAVHGRRNWIRGVSLRLAVGVVKENGEFRFVGGPVNAVKAVTNVYVIIVPGDFKSKALFKRVLNILSGRMSKEMREEMLKLSVESVREYFPYSIGRILED